MTEAVIATYVDCTGEPGDGVNVPLIIGIVVAVVLFILIVIIVVIIVVVCLKKRGETSSHNGEFRYAILSFVA